MGLRCIVLAQAVVGSIVPCVLQTIALFTPAWLVQDGVYKGLFYSRQKDGSHNVYEVLDQATLGLEATSALLLLLCSISCCVTALVYGPDEFDDIDNDFKPCFGCNCVWFYCNLFAYVVADILILSGCCKFGATHPMEQLGASFYLCIVSFLLILLMIFIFLCDQLCKPKREDGVFSTLLEKVYKDAA